MTNKWNRMIVYKFSPELYRDQGSREGGGEENYLLHVDDSIVFMFKETS